MDGKLIKKEGIYYLSYDFKDAGSTEECEVLGKPSLKNCEAIANGYDLDDCVDYFEKGKLYIQQDGVIILAGENVTDGIVIKDPLKSRGVGHYSNTWNPKAFCEYNLESLEILGDKKFSEEDVRKAFESGYETLESDRTYNEHYEEMIQSLQQTEWEVIVEMEYQGFEEDGKVREAYLPKLDANGCLILKRKV